MNIEALQQIMSDAASASGTGDSLDHIIAEATAANRAAAQQSEKQRKAEARIVADCFDTEAGRRCLSLLLRKTIHRPPGEDDLTPAALEPYALRQARREGTNQIMWIILSALAVARGIDPEEPTA